MQIQLSKKECEANIALKNWREDNEALKLAFKAAKAQEGSENAYTRYARYSLKYICSKNDLVQMVIDAHGLHRASGNLYFFSQLYKTAQT